MKSIGVVSDLHCGSIYGLLPPSFDASDGRSQEQNVAQKYLWACWLDAAKQLKQCDALVINGDIIDGNRHGSGELCLPLIEDQAQAAVETIQCLVQDAKLKIYCVSGTEAHDSDVGREMEVVAGRLDATRYSSSGQGRYCRDVLDLDVSGTVINFSHGISVAGGLYRATPPDREGVWSALAGKTGKAIKADCVVRSHVHTFCHVEHASKHIVVTPAWQLQTRYMRRNSIYRTMPDIGYIIIEINEKDDDPCHVRKKIYPLPQMKPTRL